MKINKLDGSIKDAESVAKLVTIETDKYQRKVVVVGIKHHSKDEKRLYVGHAIHHPEDSFDFIKGLDCALKRAINSEPLMTTKYSRTMSKKVIDEVLNTYVRHMTENFETYLNL